MRARLTRSLPAASRPWPHCSWPPVTGGGSCPVCPARSPPASSSPSSSRGARGARATGGSTTRTPAGTPVRSAGAGTVTFAGAVAGAVWVTVAHDGGMLTSYGPLRQVRCVVARSSSAGDLLGRSAGSLHFGVRLDGRYVDPALLLGEAVHLVPRLVPLGGSRPASRRKGAVRLAEHSLRVR